MDTATNYPDIADRVKAQVADGAMIVLFLFGITLLFSAFDNVPDEARMVSSIFIFVLYNPLMITFFGGTIGHKMIDLKVVRKPNPDQYPNIFKSILRFLIKGTLGIISLLTIFTDNKNKAIHDILSGTIVLYDSQYETESTNT